LTLQQRTCVSAAARTTVT